MPLLVLTGSLILGETIGSRELQISVLKVNGIIHMTVEIAGCCAITLAMMLSNFDDGCRYLLYWKYCLLLSYRNIVNIGPRCSLWKIN